MTISVRTIFYLICITVALILFNEIQIKRYWKQSLSEYGSFQGQINQKINRALHASQCIVKNNKDCTTKKSITIFTTFSPNSKKKNVFQNTVKIWHFLKHYAFLSLYCNTLACIRTWANFTKKFGWDIHNIPQNNHINIPQLKYMYMDAISRYNSTFYAYCNGDIIFDYSLYNSLQSVETFAKKGEKLLIIGRRSNFPVAENITFNNLNMVTMAYKKSTLFTPYGEDYFIYTKNAINWTNIPDIVVGKIYIYLLFIALIFLFWLASYQLIVHTVFIVLYLQWNVFNSL